MNDCVPLKKCLYGTNSDFVILIDLMNILESYIRLKHSFLLPGKADTSKYSFLLISFFN